MFALAPGGEILTEALIGRLQRQATHDADPLVRATAASIPRIYDTYTFRELTWALTRNAALDAPTACLPPVPRGDFRQYVRDCSMRHREGLSMWCP